MNALPSPPRMTALSISFLNANLHWRLALSPAPIYQGSKSPIGREAITGEIHRDNHRSLFECVERNDLSERWCQCSLEAREWST